MIDVDSESYKFYASNPVACAEDIIGIELDSWQEDVLNALNEFGFVAIRSGSGVGKTVVLSIASLWFLGFHFNAKVPTTAPSMHQLYDVLWSQHFNLISKSPVLREMLEWTQTKITVKGFPGWYAVARTATVSPSGQISEGLQGYHASDDDNLLFVIDEASGVKDPIFPAIEGALTGEKAYVLMASNPTRRNGYFYDVFNKLSMRGMYKLFHIKCSDSPRVKKRYFDMMGARYGEGHPIYQIKVLGEFAEADENLLFPPDYIESMQNNTRNDMYDDYPIELGIDVGLSNAATVCIARQGYNILSCQEYQKRGKVSDLENVIQWLSDIIGSYDPARVRVDKIGMGEGVYSALKSRFGEHVVVPVVGGARAKNPKEFANIRAEIYWNLRDIVPRLWCRNFPDRLIVELSDIRYDQRTGRIKIESKEDMLARALRSPDYADALCYAFAEWVDEVFSRNIPFSQLYVDINNSARKGSIWAGERESKWSM